MATLYFNGAVDTNWDTLLNWWQDSGYTIPALATPANGDTVYIDGKMDSGPNGANVSLVNIICGTINGSGFNVTLNGSFQAEGPAEFHNECTNYGYVTGNATFNDSSYNSGTVTGNATFTYLTATAGSVVDVTGYANGKVGGTTYDSVHAVITMWVFNSTSNNSNVTGNATFNDSSSNSGNVNGDATFNDSSTNNNYNSNVNGDATFNDSSTNNFDSNVNGDATFNDSSTNYGGNVYGDATFNDSSTNYGGVGGNATFNDSSSNSDDGIDDDYSNVTGNATFNDSSSNSGYVGGNAEFNDSSSNSGYVGGNAEFNNNSTNTGTVTGNTTFQLSAALSTLRLPGLSSVTILGTDILGTGLL